MTMIAGDLHTRSPMLIVGFDQYLDFYPSMVADNLISQGFLAKYISLDLPTLQKNKYVNSMVLARLFDIPLFREEVISSLKKQSRHVERIGFPAVLGIDKSLDVIKHLEESLGVRVFEIPGLPPSIPGIRLHNLLSNTILSHHGIIDNGMQVILADVESKTVKSIWSEAASRVIGHRANDFIVATGGLLGGGIVVNHNGYAKDTVFDLPIKIPQPHSSKFQDRFLSSKGHPIFQSGLQVDNELHPVSENGDLEFENVHAAGSIIGNCDPVRELSLEGIAITTGFFVGENI
jgi:glycerol-3-phosphate dehydrogenase subunit B